MDKKTQKIGVICSIVQIILSIICLIYSAINQENIIMWVLFLCSGILSLSSNISRNNKKEDEWGSANSSLQNWLKRARRSSFSFFIIVSLWYNRDIKIGSWRSDRMKKKSKILKILKGIQAWWLQHFFWRNFVERTYGKCWYYF